MEYLIPIRPSKNQDEIAWDYIFRLSQANGFSTLEKFQKYILENASCKMYENLNSKKNMKRFGTNQIEKYISSNKLSKYQVALEWVLQRTIFNEELDDLKESYILLKERKICQQCWSEHQYVRFFWRFECYKICHIHSIQLIKFKKSKDFSSDLIFSKKSTGDEIGKCSQNNMDFLIRKYHRENYQVKKIYNELFIINFLLWMTNFSINIISSIYKLRGNIKSEIFHFFISLPRSCQSPRSKLENLIVVLSNGHEDIKLLFRITMTIMLLHKSPSEYSAIYPYCHNENLDYILWAREQLRSITCLDSTYKISSRVTRFIYNYKLDDLIYNLEGVEEKYLRRLSIMIATNATKDIKICKSPFYQS
ncbi:TniQ family protein [Yersinia intermedia]|uniref:TniQ domain-containing protein n=1 Tax=Yersinia intermedia TaxID=631 RepID=A0A0T9MU51_YERIN|nr:TniQ family protein [Yersinia intermedia]CNG47400.1 Uncharacterised protein [Yersinia intermedia]